MKAVRREMPRAFIWYAYQGGSVHSAGQERVSSTVAVSTSLDSSAQALGHADLPKLRFGFVEGHFFDIPNPARVGYWRPQDLAAGAGLVRVPSQEVAQMTFLGSNLLGTQEKVYLEGSRRLLIFSAGRVTRSRT